MKKAITGLIILALLFSLLTILGSPVKAELGDAKGYVINANPVITEKFTVTANGTVETGRDADIDGNVMGYNPGLDAVLYPQFNDVLTITGAITDYNGLEARNGGLKFDELYPNPTAPDHHFCIQIYEDVDGDGIITPASLGGGDYMKWNFTANLSNPNIGSIGGTYFSFDTNGTIQDEDSNPAELRFDDGNGDGNIEWLSSGLNTSVLPIYHEVWFLIEDEDGTDLEDNATNGSFQATGMNGTFSANTPNSVGRRCQIGFYTQQAYKILGIYDEDALTWVSVWDDSDPDTSMVWTFRSIPPDGINWNEARSGPIGWQATAGPGDQDYLLAIQWLVPDTLAATLVLNFVETDFTTYLDDGITPLDTIPIDGRMDIAYGNDTNWDGAGGQGEIPFDYNDTYTPDAPTIPEDYSTWVVIDDDADGEWSIPNVGKDPLSDGSLRQYNVVFIWYEVEIPPFTFDGIYTATFTLTATT